MSCRLSCCTAVSPEAQARMKIVHATLAMADEVGDNIVDAQLQLQATRVE